MPTTLTSPQDPKDPYLSSYDEERILMITDQEAVLAKEDLIALQTVSYCEVFSTYRLGCFLGCPTHHLLPMLK